ncbi:hypothetical protein O3M35_006167 [Rhynocoris fuscipes]|uniref:Uncharacterized protein n=1 Tax=Rhynocoris fuscipes TaxID=488301 RepID=A0AAW1DG07_9HEMI
MYLSSGTAANGRDRASFTLRAITASTGSSMRSKYYLGLIGRMLSSLMAAIRPCEVYRAWSN